MENHTEFIARRVLDAAFAVHTELGPGMLETCYESCLAYELETAGLAVQRQPWLAIQYRELEIPHAFRADLIVEHAVLIEIKAQSQIDAVHITQVATYLRWSGLRLGLLLNFGVVSLRHGIRRVIASRPSKPPNHPPLGPSTSTE